MTSWQLIEDDSYNRDSEIVATEAEIMEHFTVRHEYMNIVRNKGDAVFRDVLVLQDSNQRLLASQPFLSHHYHATSTITEIKTCPHFLNRLFMKCKSCFKNMR